jgi:cbb3-type cytochrome oxidase subunit 3
MGNGEQIGIFSYGSLAPDEKLSVTLSGELIPPPMTIDNEPQAVVEQEPVSQSAIAIGVVVLGLAFMGVGYWWYRQPDEEAADDEMVAEDLGFKELVTQIALLDEAHDRGEIEQGVYEEERAALYYRAQLTVAEAD